MMHYPTAVLMLVALICLSGCQGARPFAPDASSSSSRQLLGVQAFWGGLSCPGLNNIGFGTSYQALALPSHNLIIGHVQLHNRGPQPFGFQGTGFKLSGGAPIDGGLKCPQSFIPAGGVLQCGFIAQAPQPLSYSSFQPFFVPDSSSGSSGPCFCQQPFPIRPFIQGPPAFNPQRPAGFSNGAVAKSFADACAQAFGGAAFSEALAKANSWSGDAYGLANAIADSVFGRTAAAANAMASSQAWGGAQGPHGWGKGAGVGGGSSTASASASASSASGVSGGAGGGCLSGCGK